MNILITPDKFKGSLSAKEAADAIESGIRRNYKGQDSAPLEIVKLQMADGGDGSLNVVERYFGGKRVKCIAQNPIGRDIDVEYLLRENKDGSKEAFIEMARVSGLELLAEGERNPLYTSTYGLGTVIKHAVQMGAGAITLSIGGSATNDCGAGMLQALGLEAETAGGKIVSNITGGDLCSITKVNLSGLRWLQDSCGSHDGKSVKFKVICDVDNPLFGERGATYIYGPQKGADAAALVKLEKGIENFSHLADECCSGNVVAEVSGAYRPGAGAAGGVGYAMSALLGAEMIGGSNFFAGLMNINKLVEWADLVITGEGRVDEQSFYGKVVGTIYGLCEKHEKPLVIFCGVSSLDTELYSNLSLFSISSIAHDSYDSMKNAYSYLQILSGGINNIKKV